MSVFLFVAHVSQISKMKGDKKDILQWETLLNNIGETNQKQIIFVKTVGSWVIMSSLVVYAELAT